MALRGRVIVEGANADIEVIGVVGEEQVSRLYAFDLTLSTRLGRATVERLLRSRLTVELDPPELAMLRAGALVTQPLSFSGIVSRSRVVFDVDGFTVFKVTLVPKLWELTQTRHSRIFTDADFPTILRAVLESEGITADDYRIEFEHAYEKREHVCQYKESSFDFLSRWMEREGIHYHFVHEGDQEVIVFADHNGAFGESRSRMVRYFPVGGDASQTGAAHRVRCKVQAVTQSVEMFDADPWRPTVDVRGKAPVDGGLGGRFVRWGENFVDPAQATRDAKLRAEAFAALRETFVLEAKGVDVRAGHTVSLFDHPIASYNDELLPVSVKHVAVDPAITAELRRRCSLPAVRDYHAEVRAQRKSVAFRPMRVTPWPRIGGMVDATVDGPSTSDYAQLDGHGRYKVDFHFDESDLTDGSRSTYVRRLQPHGGSIEGFHFPLRKGTEVEVMFLGGDPDKPMIVGASPNVETPSKVSSANATKNVIHTGGDNRIEMEDLSGGQWVRLTTPTASTMLFMGAGAHNVVGSTTGKGNVVTGTHVLMEVGSTKREDVTGSLTETYAASHTFNVVGAVTETQHTSVTTTITGPTTHTITGPFVETISAAVTEEFLAAFTTTVNGGTTLTFDSGLDLTVTGGVTENFDSTYARDVTGTMQYVVTGTAKEDLGATSRTVNGNYDLTVDGTYTLRCATLDGDASQWDNTDAMLEGLVDLYDVTHGIDIQVTGLSMTAYGAMLKLYGSVSSTTVLGLTVAGLTATLAGMSVCKAPVRAKVDGPEMATGGLDVEITALVIKI